MKSEKTRIFSEFYDSVRQRRNYARGSQVLEALRARLRFDWLLHKTVVLTDAQLLDGAFFHEVTSEFIVNTLPRHEDGDPALEVRSRSGDLRQDLVRMVQREPGVKYSPILWSSMENQEKALDVSRALPELPVEVLETHEDVVQTLRSAGLDHGGAAKISEGWSRCLSYEHDSALKGLVRVQKWTSTLDINAAFAEEPLNEAKDRLKTDCGIDFLYEAERLKGSRNLFAGACAEKKAQNANHDRTLQDQTLRDILAVESRYHRAYNRALAKQHDCEFDSIDQAIRPATAVREFFDELVLGKKTLDERLAIPLPPGFLQYLAALPLKEFCRLVECNKTPIKRWWYQADSKALKEAFRNIGNQAGLKSNLPKFVEVPLKILVEQKKVRIFLGTLIGGEIGSLVPGGTLLGAAVGAVVGEELAEAMELSEEALTPEGCIARRIVECGTRRHRP